MGGDTGGVDSGRSDDQLQIRPTGEQRMEVAKQKIDVETAFVGFVNNDRVVAEE